MTTPSPRPADDRLVAMARWLVSLDDESMAAARRTLTLDDVIGEARAALAARTPQLAEPDWIEDGVEHWEAAGFWVERDTTGRDGPTWRLNGDVVSRWVVQRFRDALDASLTPAAPQPAVPDGEDDA